MLAIAAVTTSNLEWTRTRSLGGEDEDEDGLRLLPSFCAKTCDVQSFNLIST